LSRREISNQEKQLRLSMSDSGAIVLCRIEDIPDGGARGFALPGKRRSVFGVRRGPQAYVYLNWCPHAGAELEFAKDRFLSADGERIVCFAHGAHFAVETGACVAGPCAGQSLKPLLTRIVDGSVLVICATDDQLNTTSIEG
jgi:nitrite reductase/ring-hydroxylating ferredoxin subunit